LVPDHDEGKNQRPAGTPSRSPLWRFSVLCSHQCSPPRTPRTRWPDFRNLRVLGVHRGGYAV